ncbi:inositol-3,4-bisphosphate 4-phosphatase [Achlya hypogyna]|uniref:Inositol-3,4-bisphosphate 4-phosphatase n=1 Tax=Achlya hypogyna TaxID=1202772 RepID=A0A1V9ZKK7_ACHHY|nr:inositol-3,4-bisphosphate 4-phosphatase [Achlya hypogyna]
MATPEEKPPAVDDAAPSVTIAPPLSPASRPQATIDAPAAAPATLPTVTFVPPPSPASRPKMTMDLPAPIADGLTPDVAAPVDVKPTLIKPPLKRSTFSRADSERPIRKELITLFVSCSNLNLPALPQTFFQSVFKKKNSESSTPECRVEVEMRRPDDTVVEHLQATEPRRSRNPSYTMGFTIPIPLSTKTLVGVKTTYNLYFRVMQTDVGLEKVVAKAEVSCATLLDSFRQGAPFVHLPLAMAGATDAILSLTFGRVFPVKHSVVPTQNMLLHMYSLTPAKDAKDIPSKRTLIATEEVLEVGYHASVPPLLLHQAYKEIEAAHRLWTIRYNNARKSAMDFASAEEALANGCDVYAIEVISGRGLKLPPNLPPVTPTRTSRSSSSATGPSDASGVTLNPFVMVKFRETTKGKRPIEISEGKTNVEQNTSEPNWAANIAVDSKPKADVAKKDVKAKNQNFVFFRPSPVNADGHSSNHALERVLQFDVASECVSHHDGQIDIGQVLVPVKAILYEGSNDVYAINVTKWLPVLSATGDVRGELLIRIQLRRTTLPFLLEPETPSNGTLFKLADPVRDRSWQAKIAAQEPPKALSIAELKEEVASLHLSLSQLAQWIQFNQDHTDVWFRSSQDKTTTNLQPFATNLHVAYFRLFKGLEPSPRGARDAEPSIMPGTDMSAFLSRLDSTSLDDIAVLELQDMLEVDATYSTVTCGAPTAHALGLSKTGLIEMEESLMACDKAMERVKTDYGLRKAVCLSQALSVLVTTFMTQLELCVQRMVPTPDRIMEQWAAVGFLIGWESLVSTQGKELHMLSDAWIAIKSLERFAIRLVSGDVEMELHVRDDGYVLDLPVPSVHFGALPAALQDGKLISITAVLFTQGINEMQTLANAVGAAGIELQTRVNEKSLKALQKYLANLVATPGLRHNCASLRLEPLAALIGSTEKKNTRILLEASDCVRRMNGGRVTFCKSGKDRTAMSVTLDQARILGSTWKQATVLMKESTMEKEWLEIKPIANFMREYGVRIEVAKKNVGQARYSFNSLQRKCLPKIYRPSHAAIQGSHDHLPTLVMAAATPEEPIVSFFFSVVNANVRGPPQSFLQGALASLRGQSPDVPECQLQVERITRGSSPGTPSSNLMYETEIVKAANPCFSVGIQLASVTSEADSLQDELHIVLVRVSDKMAIASCVVAMRFIANQVQLGAPVIYLPLTLRRGQALPPTITNPIMLGAKDAALALSVSRLLPMPHALVPTKNLLFKTYLFPAMKLGPRRVAEEVMEVGYHTQVPKMFLKHMHAELQMFTELWHVRCENERKRQLVFDTDDDALAAGCDVFHVAVLEARNLKLDGVPLPAAQGTSPPADGSPGNPPTALNPFIRIQFGETDKPTAGPDAPPPATPMQIVGRTPTEMATTNPVWGMHRRTSVASTSPLMKKMTSDVVLPPATAPKPASAYSIYRPSHRVSNSKGVVQLGVFHEAIARVLEVPIGHVIVPWRILKMKSSSMSPDAPLPDPEAEFAFELDDWVPIYPKGDRRSMIGGAEPVGEVHVQIRIRCSKVRFGLVSETALGAVDQAPIFCLADKAKHHELRRRAKPSHQRSEPDVTPIPVDVLARHVATLDGHLADLARMMEDVQERDTEGNWFRASTEKKELLVQPLATNLHLSYFRSFQELPLRPFSADMTSFRASSLGSLRGDEGTAQPALDVQEAVAATVSCGAPTAHALGLDKHGLLDLEDAMMTATTAAAFDSAKHAYMFRKVLCVSQSLSVLVTSFVAQLELALSPTARDGHAVLAQWAAIGYLVQWESLVSSQGHELRMLSDAWVAIKTLERFVFQFEAADRLALRLTTASDGKGYVLHVPLPSATFSALPGSLQAGATIAVVPILFSQGINEMQSLANMIGTAGWDLQHKVNQKSFKALKDYVASFAAMGEHLHVNGAPPQVALATLTTLLEAETKASATKNTRLLLEASDIVRGLNGGRVTFCKSGKDRTAMSVTLDQMRTVYATSSQTRDVEALVKPVANVMRAYGARIDIAEKNIGLPKYSFNALQRKMLPKMYRPPLESIQGMAAKNHT